MSTPDDRHDDLSGCLPRLERQRAAFRLVIGPGNGRAVGGRVVHHHHFLRGRRERHRERRRRRAAGRCGTCTLLIEIAGTTTL